MNVNEYVQEVLKLSGTKERFSGVVSKIIGTTTWIKSGEREFLGWSSPELIVGSSVVFSIDQLRAVRVEVQKISAG